MKNIMAFLGFGKKNPNPMQREMSNALSKGYGNDVVVNTEPGTARFEKGVWYLMDVDDDEIQNNNERRMEK